MGPMTVRKMIRLLVESLPVLYSRFQAMPTLAISILLKAGESVFQTLLWTKPLRVRYPEVRNLVRNLSGSQPS